MNTEKLNIVLADDDEDDRLLFELAIKEINVPKQLLMFKNGTELIQHLRDNRKNLPDIIFLDLNMPNKNGLECLKEIKLDLGLGDITVVIYSTSSSDKDIQSTFLEGANIYINKPTDFNKLKKTIERVLTLDWQYHTSLLNRENFLFRL